MKKTIVALLFAVSVMSLAACQPGKKAETTQEDTTSVQTEKPAMEMTAPADSTAEADTTQMN